jgi:trans-aconitate 2-methyltransferase
MPGWDPSQYLKFAGPRLQPALDLLARVGAESPTTVVDLGCGAGNVTRLLTRRWPDAHVSGVDGSAEMLTKARGEDGGIEWIEADLKTWSPAQPAEVVYSNAVFHWLDDHESLFPHLLGHVAPGGALAVQMPRNHGNPSHTCMIEAAHAGPWKATLESVLRPSPVAPPEAYYDILAPRAAALDIWETVYTHVLDGDNPVVEWTKGTALKPLLDALVEGPREAFLAEYAARIAAAYPRRADGKTLFPFRRLFILAVR